MNKNIKYGEIITPNRAEAEGKNSEEGKRKKY